MSCCGKSSVITIPVSITSQWTDFEEWDLIAWSVVSLSHLQWATLLANSPAQVGTAIMMGRFVHGKSPITLMAAHSTSQRPARSLGLQKATPNPWLPAISKWTCKQEACLPKSNSVKEALLKSRRAHILRKPGCFNICYKIWFVCLLHPDLDKEKLAIVIDILVIDALVYRCGVTLKIVGKLQLVQNSF